HLASDVSHPLVRRRLAKHANRRGIPREGTIRKSVHLHNPDCHDLSGYRTRGASRPVVSATREQTAPETFASVRQSIQTAKWRAGSFCVSRSPRFSSPRWGG